MAVQFGFKLALWAAALYIGAQVIGGLAHSVAFSVVGPIITALQ